MIDNNKCDTIEEICGGSSCKFELNTAKFASSTRKSTKDSCCLRGTRPLSKWQIHFLNVLCY